MKSLKENVGETLKGDDFLANPQRINNNSKTSQGGLYQTQKLLAQQKKQ